MMLSKNPTLKTEQVRPKKHKVVVARRNLLKNVHGRESIELGWWRMCTGIDVLRMEEEIDKNDEKIGEVNGEIFLLKNEGVLCDMNEDKLELMNNETSRHVFTEIKSLLASCKEVSGVENSNGHIMCFARLDA